MAATDKNPTDGQGAPPQLDWNGQPGSRWPADVREKMRQGLPPDPVKVIDGNNVITGACPDCQERDATLGTLNNGAWHVCHHHRKKWQTEPRTRDGTGDYERNAAILADYEEVEPFWPKIATFGLDFFDERDGHDRRLRGTCPVCSSPLETGLFGRVFTTTRPDEPLCMYCARQFAPALAALSDLAYAAQELFSAAGVQQRRPGLEIPF